MRPTIQERIELLRQVSESTYSTLCDSWRDHVPHTGEANVLQGVPFDRWIFANAHEADVLGGEVEEAIRMLTTTGYSQSIRELATDLGHPEADPFILEGFLRQDPDTGNGRCPDSMSTSTMKRHLKGILAMLDHISKEEAERIATCYMGRRRSLC